MNESDTATAAGSFCTAENRLFARPSQLHSASAPQLAAAIVDIIHRFPCTWVSPVGTQRRDTAATFLLFLASYVLLALAPRQARFSIG